MLTGWCLHYKDLCMLWISCCIALKLRASLLKGWSLYNVYRAIKVRLHYDGAFLLTSSGALVCTVALLQDMHGGWFQCAQGLGFQLVGIEGKGMKCAYYLHTVKWGSGIWLGSVLFLRHEDIHDIVEFMSRLETFDHYTIKSYLSGFYVTSSHCILCANVICL